MPTTNTTSVELARRLDKIEKELAEIKQHLQFRPGKAGWLERIIGRHANDPAFDEVVRLGREFRQSQRCDESV